MQLMTDNSTKTLINLTKQIYNGLTQAIEDGDTKEAAERLKQDDVISAKVTAETDARIQADSDEATTRQTKDAELQTAIETETSERKGADTSLQSNIDKEATTRASADTAINTKLDPIKELIDTVFLGEIVKAYDKGMANNKYKPVYFGTVNYNDVGLGAAGNGDATWHKEAVKVLYTRLKDKGYKGACLVWGAFQPAMYQWVIGSMSISTDGTYSEDASGYPTNCQFISLTYGGGTMYRFGTENDVWYFETIPTTTQVNTLISNAKTALETAYKNADTQLQTDITTAYQQADSNLSTTLTQAYTDADTALRTELEGKINSITANTTGLIETQNIAEAKIMTATVDAYGPTTETVSVISLSDTEQYAVKTSLSITTKVNANTPITCPVASNGIIYGMLRNNAYDSVKTRVYPILTIYPQTLTINSDKTAKIEVLKTDRYGREINNIYDKYTQLSISNIKLYK